MTTENFDYEEFSQKLLDQIKPLIPPDIEESDRQQVENLVYNFCYLTGNGLSYDTDISLNNYQIGLVSQLIGEWAFHKVIDFIHSGIPKECREKILQQNAFTIYETAKTAFLENLPQEEMIDIIEQKVNKSYKETLEEFVEKHAISKEAKQKAIILSNIDDIVKSSNEPKKQSDTDTDTAKIVLNNNPKQNIWQKSALKTAKLFKNLNEKIKPLKDFFKFQWLYKNFDNIRETYIEYVERINILMSYVLLVCIILFIAGVKYKFVTIGIITVLFIYFVLGDIYTEMKTKHLLKEIDNTKQKMQELGTLPVVLCSQSIRLPLYQLLVRHIEDVVVISYSELITDIRLEAVDTIEKD